MTLFSVGLLVMSFIRTDIYLRQYCLRVRKHVPSLFKHVKIAYAELKVNNQIEDLSVEKSHVLRRNQFYV